MKISRDQFIAIMVAYLSVISTVSLILAFHQ